MTPRSTMFHPFNVLGAALPLAAGIAIAPAQTFTGIGQLPGRIYSAASDVSGDGSAVVGSAYDAAGNYLAVVWVPSPAPGRLQDLGTLPGATSASATGANHNASVIVGSSGEMAFRWVATLGSGGIGTMNPLGFLPPEGRWSVARSVSANGSVVAGYADFDGFRFHPFRWTATSGMTDLGILPAALFSRAHGVSANGVVVVGMCDGAGVNPTATRWTSTTGLRSIAVPPIFDSCAWATSANGSVVVGGAAFVVFGYYSAFRWTAADGMVELGILPDTVMAEARAVSGDGSTIVGASSNNSGIIARAFLWTAQLGMVDLNTYLPTLGIDLTGWNLTRALAVSASGHTITGNGTHNGVYEGWVANLGPECPADINDSGFINSVDFFEFINAFLALHPLADFNRDTFVASVDFFAFLSAFFTGC